jgi:hypothetical protein
MILRAGRPSNMHRQIPWQIIEEDRLKDAKKFHRLTINEDISRILSALDLLEPKYVVDPRMLKLKDLVIVSAWSSNHHSEAE